MDNVAKVVEDTAQAEAAQAEKPAAENAALTPDLAKQAAEAEEEAIRLVEAEAVRAQAEAAQWVEETKMGEDNKNDNNTNSGGSLESQISPMYNIQESQENENTLIEDVKKLLELLDEAVQKENKLLKVPKTIQEEKDNNEKDYPIAYSFTDPFIIKEEEYNNSYEIGNFTFPILKSNEDCVVRKETEIELHPKKYNLPKFISLLEKKLKKIKILDIEKINQTSKTNSKYNLKIKVKGHDIIKYITSDNVIEEIERKNLSLKSKLFNFEPENEEIKYPFFDSDLIINRKESNEEDEESLMVLLKEGDLKKLLTNYYNIYNELDSVNDKLDNDKLEFKELIKFSKKLKENEKNRQLDLDYVIDEYDKILKKYFEKLKDSISKELETIPNPEFNKLDPVLQAKIKKYIDEYNELYRNADDNDHLYSIKYTNIDLALDAFMEDMMIMRKTEKNETNQETGVSQEKEDEPIETLAQRVLEKAKIEEILQKLREEIVPQIKEEINKIETGENNPKILEQLLKKIDLINVDLKQATEGTENAYKELNIAEVEKSAKELQNAIQDNNKEEYDTKLKKYIDKLNELEKTVKQIEQIYEQQGSVADEEYNKEDDNPIGGKRNRYKHSFKSRKRKGGKKVKNAHSMRKGKRRGTKGSRKR